MSKLHIRKVGVLSVAKIQAVVGLVIGLIIGILYFLIFAIFGAVIMGLAGKQGAAAGGVTIIYGVVALIGFPIFYGIMGFIGGAIVSLVYNLVAKTIGGIEIEVESDSAGFLNPPSPPQNWANQQQPQYRQQ